MPMLKKPTSFQLKQSEKERQESILKNVADKNYYNVAHGHHIKRHPITYSSETGIRMKPRSDLVHNFHWDIMMARRLKKLSQAQLAREIGESEAAIHMAENGVLPEDDYKIIKKLESYLGIRLVKEERAKEREKKQPARIIGFDPMEIKKITISDLKKMKEQKEEALRELNEEEIENELQENDANSKDESPGKMPLMKKLKGIFFRKSESKSL